MDEGTDSDGAQPVEAATKWGLKRSVVLYEHRWLTLIEDTVELPSGAEMTWLRFKDGPVAVMIICLDSGRVLVCRQYCHPPGRAVCEFPGGGTEDGESYAQAATRELMEEAGLRPGHLEEIGTFLPMNRRSATSMRVFVATDCAPQSLLGDEGQVIERFWFAP